MTPAVVDGPLMPLPGQPARVPWPGDEWPVGDLPGHVDLDRLMAVAFDPRGPLHETYAVVIVHGGRLVVERYAGRLPGRDGPGPPVTPETALRSWSVAKSVLHAAVGLLVADGRVALDEPAPVPQWRVADDDPRRLITVQDLLGMRDGLAFVEDYDDADSDVRRMLFGDGRSDVAAYAAGRPLAALPGIRFQYSSGTSNVLSGVVARAVGPGDGYRAFLAERLFDPVGMTTARAGFDEAGTWVAASSLYASARDYARYALLYLRDGIWGDRRLLPDGWVDHGRRTRSVDPDSGDVYGSHWWTSDNPYGTFWASGHQGQFVDICPALDLVLVRLGHSDATSSDELRRWRTRVIEAFDPGRE